ncbi:MAG: hypothetical protein IJD59_08115 [Clostridia bacterium]|nr:hypothetical protein [Clostridia bacterium]
MQKRFTSVLKKFPMSDGEKKWQKFLRAKGYTDEDEPEETPQTEASANGKNRAAEPRVTLQAPEQTPSYTPPKAFSHPEFSFREYGESAEVADARNELLLHADKKPGAYQSRWQSDLDDLMDQIAGRKPFSYDPTEDALYHQYRDRYIRDGRLAMNDAVGKASAMTGGYTNSYAQSVGQQAYRASLGQLDEIVPELYRMALDRYTAQGEALNDRYDMLSEREKADYEAYLDSLSAYMKEKEYLTERFENERDADYGRYTEERDFAYGSYTDGRDHAYGVYRDETDDGYRQYRDAVEDGQWEREFAESKRQYDENFAFKKKQYEDKLAEKNQSGVTDGGIIQLGGENGAQTFPAESIPSEKSEEQPDSIGGMKLTDSGLRTTVNGEEQTLWLAGGKYWIWRKDLGRYIEAEGFKRV